MAARLIIGRAGTGKTALCAREIRAAMAADPLGPPLLWIVPEQGTFAAERLLLTSANSDSAPRPSRGTFRAQVLSFRRLALIIARDVGLFTPRPGQTRTADDDGGGVPKPMDEIARAILLEETVRQHRTQLSVFAGVADRPGFLQKLDTTLRELRQHGHTGATLRTLLQGNGKFDPVGRRKLQDLAVLLDAWSEVVENNDVLGGGTGAGGWDFEHLMHHAALKIGQCPLITGSPPAGKARIWVDAFSTYSALEMRMLAGLALAAEQLTITLLADPDAPAIQTLRKTRQHNSDYVNGGWGLFTRTERLHRRLIDTFRRHQVPLDPPVALRHTHRFTNPLLARIESQLLDEAPPSAPNVQPTLFDAPETPVETPNPNPPPSPGMEIWESSDPETEVRIASQTIRQLVLATNLRYRQIAVIVPELDESSSSAGGGGYQDAIRRIFTQHHIPHFIDQRRSMGHHPLVELLKSAVAFVSSRCQRDPLLLLLKTQLAGIPEDDVALLENYIIEHGILGGPGGLASDAWSQPWTWLAPNQTDEDDVPESTRHRLTQVNTIRNRIWTTLHPFIETLTSEIPPPENQPAERQTPNAERPSDDASRFPRALRHLLATLAVEKHLQSWITTARESNNPELAQVHEQVWREVTQLLTLLESLLTGRQRTLAEFERLLATALQNLSLGLIPPTVDQVIVSGVTRPRIPEMHTVIILGAVEGQFPKVVPEDPILSDAQRETFNTHAADPIGEGSDRQLLEMPFFDYVALTRARRQLIISHPIADRQGKALAPSRHITRLRDLFPDAIAERKFDAQTHLNRVATVDDLLAGVTSWIRTLRVQDVPPRDNDLMPALYNYLITTPYPAIATARQLLWPTSTDGGGAPIHLGTRTPPHLSPTLAERFYPPRTPLRMSVSQLEKYAACPLHYFLHYTLGLKPRKEFALDQLSLGQLQHRILERVYRRIIDAAIPWPDCPPETLRNLLATETAAAIAELHAEIAQTTPGYDKTRLRLLRTLGLMLEADRRRALHGDLRPAAVELTFGIDPAAAQRPRLEHGRIVSLPVLTLPLPRHTLHVNGKIDRMDESSRVDATGHKPAAVIDYKSSRQKTLDLLRIHAGLALQLPVYALVAQDLAARHPIAALYIALGLRQNPADQKDGNPTPDTDEFYQKLKPRGLVNADHAQQLDHILADAGKSDWFQLKFNKDRSLSKIGSDLLSDEDFQTVLNFTRHKVAQLAAALVDGQIAPHPYRHKSEVPCQYCDFISLCPFDPTRDPYREIAKQPPDQLLAKMRDAVISLPN